MASRRIVHFEIPAENPEVLAEFYRTMFAWNIERSGTQGPEYWLCNPGTEQPGISGGIIKKLSPEHVLRNYVDIESIDDSIARALELGGSIAMDKRVLADGSAIAVIVDPEGNVCGLWQKSG